MCVCWGGGGRGAGGRGRVVLCFSFLIIALIIAVQRSVVESKGSRLEA